MPRKRGERIVVDPLVFGSRLAVCPPYRADVVAGRDESDRSACHHVADRAGSEPWSESSLPPWRARRVRRRCHTSAGGTAGRSGSAARRRLEEGRPRDREDRRGERDPRRLAVPSWRASSAASSSSPRSSRTRCDLPRPPAAPPGATSPTGRGDPRGPRLGPPPCRSRAWRDGHVRGSRPP